MRDERNYFETVESTVCSHWPCLYTPVLSDRAHRHSSNGMVAYEKLTSIAQREKLTCFSHFFLLAIPLFALVFTTHSLLLLPLDSVLFFQEHLFSIWEIDIDDISSRGNITIKILNDKYPNWLNRKCNNNVWKGGVNETMKKPMKLFIYWPRGYSIFMHVYTCCILIRTSHSHLTRLTQANNEIFTSIFLRISILEINPPPLAHQSHPIYYYIFFYCKFKLYPRAYHLHHHAAY